MSVLWDKLGADLWEHKGRTTQVVLIIALGAFAIGMIIGARDFMLAGMEAMWRASSPAMIYLWNYPSVDEETISVLKHVDGVHEVEGFQQSTVEWRLTPTDPWAVAGLTARDDYSQQKFAKIDLLSGQWPHKKTFAIGQGADTVFGIGPGRPLYLRIGKKETVVTIGGILYDPNVQPPSFGGNLQLYTTRERFADLLGEPNFNRILADADHWEEAWVTAIADTLQDKLEKQDIESGGFAPGGGRVASPAKHFFQDTMDGIFFIMGVLAVLALILGLFLVYNTITALISRQVNQIGILKAIGARSGVIFRVYLSLTLTYGLLALLLALPLSALGARLLGDFLLNSFNAEGEFTISPLAMGAQVIIALVSPLVAALFPILAGARITVREAISSYGLRAGATRLDWLLAKAQWLPQLLSLTISNTFRHRQRVILTQITLVLSGLIFMTVMSVRDATLYTFDELLFSILRFNVNLQFEEPERIAHVEALTRSRPGIKAVEMWALENGTMRRAGQPESHEDEATVLFGVPLPTQLYCPQLRAGRWLQPDDGYAVVLNQQLAADVGVGVGDTVTFNLGVEGESDWQVVGLLFDPIITHSAHVPRSRLLRELGYLNRAETIWIQTEATDAGSERAVAVALRDFYREQNLQLNAASVFSQDTASAIIANVLGQIDIIITLLAVMAVVIGVVGSIALSGVLSLNVLERRREIGVLRAIGASSPALAGIFVGEGLLLGWLSWLIALPLSIPAGQAMVRGLSAALGSELLYKYTPIGALIWLGMITVLATLASWLPARAASRISVRESLVYE